MYIYKLQYKSQNSDQEFTDQLINIPYEAFYLSKSPDVWKRHIALHFFGLRLKILIHTSLFINKLQTRTLQMNSIHQENIVLIRCIVRIFIL